MTLIVEHIGKSFHRKPVLRDVSFSVRDGETVGIVGKNGAGKTTLLRIVARISFADRGDVKVGGESILDSSDTVRSKILYVGHLPNLYPVLTAEENLRLITNLYNSDATSQGILEILDRMDLLGQRWDPVRLYSRGMLQRLALAKAFVVPWDILLLDEPTTSLDEAGLKLLEEYLVEMQQEKKTMVIVSHQADWIQRFSTTLLVLENGIISTKSGKS